MSTYPSAGLTGATPGDLHWLSGSWAGQNGEDRVEEHWTDVGGGMLLGMFRWLKGAALSFYEIESIEQDGDEVVLRVKHFHAGMKAWEEKDEWLELVLVEVSEDGAVFFERGADPPRWTVYRRDGQDKLVAYFTYDVEPDPEVGVFEWARR